MSMRPVFSSLGSNYTAADSWYSLAGLFLSRFFPTLVTQQYSQIKTYFDATYEGETFFFYKGRDAIECALRASEVSSNDAVITQAFACYAVEEAIHRSGAEVVYADIAEKTSNLSLETIKAAQKQSSKPVKAVIVQYSLGCSLDTEAIAQWCKHNDIILIEDLAQGLGAKTFSGNEAGMVGDITIFSFGRDKMLDSVTGGACCLRTQSQREITKTAKWYATLEKPAVSMALTIQHLYPLVTICIRGSFRWGIGPVTVGKVLAFLAKKIGLLPTPLHAETSSASLFPLSFTLLLAHQIDGLEASLAHRRKIAQLYNQAFGNSAATFNQSVLEEGSYLRYPILVSNPTLIASKLAKRHIYVSDRWYRAAVDCSTLQCSSSYERGSAHRAERLAQRVLNLPTHRYITVEGAEQIVAAVQAAHS